MPLWPEGIPAFSEGKAGVVPAFSGKKGREVSVLGMCGHEGAKEVCCPGWVTVGEALCWMVCCFRFACMKHNVRILATRVSAKNLNSFAIKRFQRRFVIIVIVLQRICACRSLDSSARKGKLRLLKTLKSNGFGGLLIIRTYLSHHAVNTQQR